LAKAIQSVEGAKVVTAPKKGTGVNDATIAIVELSGKSTLGAVTTAIEGAQTPHASVSPPGVVAVLSGKVKPTATPEEIMDALKKAGLMAE
jgi:hypothetical protein